MMTSKPDTTIPVVYIDSCWFIELAKYQFKEKLEENSEKNVWFVNKFLEASRKGDIKVITSSLAIIECAACKEAAVALSVPPDVQTFFTNLFNTTGSGVEIVYPRPSTWELARSFRWVHQTNLKGPDSLHAATAIENGALELMTKDKAFGRLSKLPKIAIGEMKIITPKDTELLLDKYRQDALPQDNGNVISIADASTKK